jgi:hypothetical protein
MSQNIQSIKKKNITMYTTVYKINRDSPTNETQGELKGTLHEGLCYKTSNYQTSNYKTPKKQNVELQNADYKTSKVTKGGKTKGRK